MDSGWEAKAKDGDFSEELNILKFENILQRAHHEIKSERGHEKFIRSLSIVTRPSYNEISKNSPSPTRATSTTDRTKKFGKCLGSIDEKTCFLMQTLKQVAPYLPVAVVKKAKRSGKKGELQRQTPFSRARGAKKIRPRISHQATSPFEGSMSFADFSFLLF